MPTIRRLLDPSSYSPTSEPFGNNPLPRVLSTEKIDKVWFLDNAFHGQSIDLNKGSLGEVHSWLDGGRDVLNFIKHILPPHSPAHPHSHSHTQSTSDSDPLIYSYPSHTISELRVEIEHSTTPGGETLPWREVGRGRKVIGLGHSVGGNAMSVYDHSPFIVLSTCADLYRVRAAHLAPELFHALFLVEPMVRPPSLRPPSFFSLPSPLPSATDQARSRRGVICISVL